MDAPADPAAAFKVALDLHRELDREAIKRLREAGKATPEIEAAHRATQTIARAVDMALGAGADPVMLCRQLFRAGSLLLGYVAARSGADSGVAWNDMIFDARGGFELGVAGGEHDLRKAGKGRDH